MSRESLSPKVRFDVLKRDAFTCQYCGRSAPEVDLHVDHVVPVAAGGGNEPGNLTTACAECNLGKSDSFLADQLAELDTVKTQEEWIDRMVVFVRRRFAAARPEPVRNAIAEALAWGCKPYRVIHNTNMATSWIEWLRQIYIDCGMRIERSYVTDAIAKREQEWDDAARKLVYAAAAPAQDAAPADESTKPASEVN